MLSPFRPLKLYHGLMVPVSPLARCPGDDRQRVDALAQQLGECSVDEPLARHAALSGERRALDAHGEVGFAARVVAGVAAMLLAVVDDLKANRREGGGQSRRDFGRDRALGSVRHAPIYAFCLRGVGVLADGERARGPRFHGRLPSGQCCSEPGCTAAGEFRAPAANGRRPGFDGPGDWRWLCLDHVRAFNGRYNFFEGMSTEEIEEQQRPYAGWERETRAFASADRPPRWADFTDPLEAISGRFGRLREEAVPRADGKPLSEGDRNALKILGLGQNADRRALRTRYAELLRRYHPDRNGGDRSHERALQAVIDAYAQLRKAPAFA